MRGEYSRCETCGTAIAKGYSACKDCSGKCPRSKQSQYPTPKKSLHDEHDFGLYPKAYREHEDKQ